MSNKPDMSNRDDLEALADATADACESFNKQLTNYGEHVSRLIRCIDLLCNRVAKLEAKIELYEKTTLDD